MKICEIRVERDISNAHGCQSELHVNWTPSTDARLQGLQSCGGNDRRHDRIRKGQFNLGVCASKATRSRCKTQYWVMSGATPQEMSVRCF